MNEPLKGPVDAPPFPDGWTTHESEDKLRGLFELCHLGIALTDMQGRFIEFNNAFRSICGYSPEELKAIDYRALTQEIDALNDALQHEAMRLTGQYGPFESEFIRKDGSLISLRLNGILIRLSDGQEYVWSVFEDITASKAAKNEIEYLAFYDTLTRLPNRLLLMDRLQQAVAATSRTANTGALFFLDLDHFKKLNDTLGHDKGDLLLQLVAQRIQSQVREGDTVARLGGDEFVIMLEGLSERPPEAATQAELLAEQILATFNRPFQLADKEYYCTSSIGVTLFRDHEDTVNDLLRRADLAMYHAKASGRNAIRFFDPEMQTVVNARVTLEAELRHALLLQEFLLNYQPQVDEDGRITGAEALVRWQHPKRGLVPPAEFIPLAEETGQILPLGFWILDTACKQLAEWAKAPESRRLEMAVNISARQFYHPDFVALVLTIVDRTGANPNLLKLELTESVLLTNFEDIVDKMMALKNRGICFSLDDFGTGYSSLSYLKRLPLDQLKIDQSFVRDVLNDPNDAAIAKTIVALGHSLGLSIIAEGVETEDQLTFLAVNGCNAYQGYLFSPPLSANDLELFVLLNC
jgi:diguanylate cyclase (GGDEF)-like protein/PAS domain S-box-containing protein